MRLAHPDKLLSLLSVQTSPMGEASARDALDATFSSVEKLVESRLLRGTAKDTYVIKTTAFRPVLRLTNGFLTNTTIRVTVDGTEVPDTLYIVDRTLGTVALQLSRIDAHSVICVTYTYGFTHEAPPEPDIDPDDPDGTQTPVTPPTAPQIDLALLVGVPDGLKEIHLLMAASLMQTAPTNMPKDRAKAIGIHASRSYENKARTVAQQYDRPRGLSLWPTATEAV